MPTPDISSRDVQVAATFHYLRSEDEEGPPWYLMKVGLESGLPPITRSDLRDLNLAECERIAWAYVSDAFRKYEQSQRLTELTSKANLSLTDAETLKNTDPEVLDEYIAHLETVKSHIHLMAIADEYSALIKQGESKPALKIAEAHGVKPATSRSWIHRARKAGFLEAADRGRAGAASPKKPGPEKKTPKKGEGE